MKFIKIIFKFILWLIIILCIFHIIYKQINYYKNKKLNNDMQKIVNNSNIININNEFLQINNDYKLWLNIPNTKINYPVVQTINNEYYLNHNFKKDPNIGGTIFIDNKYSFEKSQNMIIFGHNMRNKSMFGTLSLFKNKEFFKQNSVINVIQGDYIYTYSIFGVATIKAENFDLKVDFKNKKDLDNYLNNIKIHANNWENENITMDSKLLTLYTCSYEFDNARLIIISKLSKKIKLTKISYKKYLQ